VDDHRIERIERRMDDLDMRAGAMERAMDNALNRSRAAVDLIVPDETRRHLKAAWRENLLAVRSMLDHWANQLNDEGGTSGGGADAASRDPGRENIPID
jgi:hypothetical protein